MTVGGGPSPADGADTGGAGTGEADTGAARAVEAAARRLADPRLQPLVTELSRRMSASSRPVRTVRLSGLDQRARRALADLLRSDRLPGPSHTVRLDRVAAGLRVSVGDLRSVVEAVAGPLEDRAGARGQAAAARATARQRLADAAGSIDPALVDWAVGQAVARGGDLDAEVAATLDALRILSAGSVRPGVPLAVLAAEVCGDPHAVDVGRRVGDLLRAAAVHLHGGSWRGALRRAGIADDDLSSLVWVLPADGAVAAVRTLADLRAADLSLPGEEVLVVENPSVLQVARSRGAGRSMVCVSGQPSAAARLAVAQLVQAGHRVLLHADFDGGGVQIVEQLLVIGRRHRPGHVEPFRMGAAEYEAAVEGSTVPLVVDRWRNPSWSAVLGAAMRRHGRAVYEEQVLDDLLTEER